MWRKRILYMIILVSLLLLVSLPSSIAQSSNYKLSSKNLEDKLMTRFTFIFYSELDRANAYISYDSWSIIAGILTDGAKKLAMSHPSDEKIKLAEENVVRLSMAAVTFGEKLPSGEIRIGESTWVKIRSNICPLWPFC